MKYLRDMTALAVVLMTLLPMTVNAQSLVPVPAPDAPQPVYEQAPGVPQPVYPDPAQPQAYAPSPDYQQPETYAPPAQPAAYLPTAGTAPQAMPEAAVTQPLAYSQEQLDQMLAPVALYPDPLLSQVLMASTYPLEVVEANRWLQSPVNASLRGDALQAALMQLPWDPSVKSLVPFPTVLAMMDNNLQWTEQIGDAFLANQPAVMDSVQRLRQLARARGNLVTTPQQVVTQQEGAIVIMPAQPQYVYVPYYNPTVIYGAWPWPAYPPFYFAPDPGYVYTTVGLIGFGVGLLVADWVWGWHHWDWHRHEIIIDDRRFAAINDHRPPVHEGTWEFDPAHRHSVPFRSPVVRQQFEHTDAEIRRSYRGFPLRSATPAAPVAAPAARPQERPAERVTGGGRPGTTVMPQHVQSFQHPTVAQPHVGTVPHPAMPQVAQPYHQPLGMPMQHDMAAPAHIQAPPGRGSPLYESFSRGPDVREQSMRGAASRAAMQAPVVRAAPVPAPVMVHGGAPVPQVHGNPGNGQQQNMRTR